MTQEINYTFDFSYDHDWRLTGTTFTMNGISKRLITLEYNELSQLKAKYFNGTATAYLQRQLYHYNARGWLTSINNPYECPNDVFAMKLYYGKVPTYASSLASNCYNGNIAMIEWFTQNQNKYVNGYGFRYDGLNRLKAGTFFSRFDASAIVEPMPTYYADGIVSGIGSEKEITYDKNGNILTLNRYGHHSGGTVLFDQLSYQYDGNRLMRVIDANPNSFLSGEFCNTAAPNLQNSYDANGNLTFDVDRNMLLFYNDDNLPTNISFSNWAMTNAYRADGVKMSKNMYNAEGRTVLQEEYFGNLVLNFGKPVRILHADGVIELNASLQPTFYYYLKDHLGNIRAVVLPTATNSVHIDQTSEYYPFGMNISKNFTSTSINKYKYNGKEEQEMPGRWLDYGARFYDPQVGRFTTVDPMAHIRESLSPYNYCSNNPILRVDPDGALDEPVYGSDGTYRGNTKEGFTGQVIIYDGDKDFSKMGAYDLLYDESFNVANQRGDANTYDRVRSELSGDAKSKIWTHIVSQMEGQKIYDETFSMSDLTGGKIHFDGGLKDNWASSYVLGKGQGKIRGGDNYTYKTTVENIQSSVVVHEWYSHIKKNQGDKFGSHRLAYKNVINYKALWNKTTDDYKGFNMRGLLKYTKDETGRTTVDPLYRNLYNKYKDKR